jgi:hypothetical protein
MPIYLRLDVLSLRLDALSRRPGGVPVIDSDLRNLRDSIDNITRLANGIRILITDPFDSSELSGTAHLADWWRDVGSVMEDALPRGCHISARIGQHPATVPMSSVALTHIVLTLVMNASGAIRNPPEARVRIWTSAPEGARPAALFVAVREEGIGQRLGEDLIPLHATAPIQTPPLTRRETMRAFVRRFGGDLVMHGGRVGRVVYEIVFPRAPEPDDAGTRRRTARVMVGDVRMCAVISALLQQQGIDVRSPADSGPPDAEVMVYDRPSFDRLAATALPDAADGTLHILVEEPASGPGPEGVRVLSPAQLLNLRQLL